MKKPPVYLNQKQKDRRLKNQKQRSKSRGSKIPNMSLSTKRSMLTQKTKAESTPKHKLVKQQNFVQINAKIPSGSQFQKDYSPLNRKAVITNIELDNTLTKSHQKRHLYE